jgi:hypothetical protein
MPPPGPMVLTSAMITTELEGSLCVAQLPEVGATHLCQFSVKLRRTHCEQMSSGLPLIADIARCSRHVGNVPNPDSCTATKRGIYSITYRRTRARAHSGNPAFRRPSINSFKCDCLRRPILADIVKAGSVSSRRAAASRASPSRPR